MADQQGSARACDACMQRPVRWRHPNTGQQLCDRCGTYAAGAMAGEYGAAREQLSRGALALSALGVDADDIVDVVTAELRGRFHRIHLERVRPEDPVPWVRALDQID